MIILGRNDILKAANMLRESKIVAIPTETVYGLAANALSRTAVSKIFQAKGRPQDNPLIVHISDISEVSPLVSKFPTTAQRLADKFWPGPLTIILPKSDIIIDEVSAGLDSVAIRLPDNEITREIIKLSGAPLAAPSANISGRPSPTSAEHVINDMKGRIDAVVDGGECSIGLESTVLSFLSDTPILLRPGFITVEDIESVIGRIDVDQAVYSEIRKGEKALSPGMQYKHYSPRAEVIIVNGTTDKYIKFVNSKKQTGVYALCFKEDLDSIKCNAISYGSVNSSDEQAKNLFGLLRRLDSMGANVIYARSPSKSGIGLAVYNRLVRAAGFNVINL